MLAFTLLSVALLAASIGLLVSQLLVIVIIALIGTTAVASLAKLLASFKQPPPRLPVLQLKPDPTHVYQLQEFRQVVLDKKHGVVVKVNIGLRGTPDLVSILPDLALFSLLAVLDLSKNKLESVDELAGIFPALPNLEVLRLHANSIVSIEALCKSLIACNPELRLLRLHYNKLDDSQVPHIAALLMKCPKLASITVHWNLFTPASKTMIAKAVASNVGCLEYVSFDTPMVNQYAALLRSGREDAQ